MDSLVHSDGSSASKRPSIDHLASLTRRQRRLISGSRFGQLSRGTQRALIDDILNLSPADILQRADLLIAGSQGLSAGV